MAPLMMNAMIMSKMPKIRRDIVMHWDGFSGRSWTTLEIFLSWLLICSIYRFCLRSGIIPDKKWAQIDFAKSEYFIGSRSGRQFLEININIRKSNQANARLENTRIAACGNL